MLFCNTGSMLAYGPSDSVQAPLLPQTSRIKGWYEGNLHDVFDNTKTNRNGWVQVFLLGYLDLSRRKRRKFYSDLRIQQGQKILQVYQVTILQQAPPKTCT